jgi:hypothetical protein
MRAITRYAAVLAIAGTCHAAAQEAYVPGTHNALALRLLKESAAAAVLRKTSLEAACPRYYLPKQKDLAWDQAVRVADERFHGDPMRRALFLWKHLPKDAPSGLLQELHLGSTGIRTECGSGCSMGLIVDPLPKDSAPNILELPRWRASLTFFNAGQYEAEGKLNDGALTVKDVKLNGVSFERLTFAKNDTLVGFQRTVPIANGERELVIGGNTSGKDGANFCYATISAGDKWLETLRLNPDLTLWSRSVECPDVASTMFQEIYDRGKLVKRVHYARLDPATGTVPITRTETFPQDGAKAKD